MRARKATDGQIDFFSSFIKIRERHRDIKGHINNKVIIHFGKRKFTITYYNSNLRNQTKFMNKNEPLNVFYLV